MEQERYSYKTPASLLVEVAEIAAPYRDRPEMLMKVITRVQKLVPAFSEEEKRRGMGMFYNIDTYNLRVTVPRLLCSCSKQMPCAQSGRERVHVPAVTCWTKRHCPVRENRRR